MKILLVNLPGEAVAGGTEIVVAQTAALLRAHGQAVTVIDHASADPAFAAAAFRTDETRARQALRAHVAQEQPDVIHLHNCASRHILADCVATGRAVRTLHDSAMACPRGKLLRPDGTPCTACRCHRACTLWRDPRRWLRFLRLRALNRRLPLIVPGARLRDACLRAGYAAARLTVIPHVYADAPDVLPGIPQPQALFIGRLQPEKGLADFLALREALPAGARLAVSGDGDLRAVVQELAARYPLQVAWDDGSSSSRRAALLRDCSCVVMPSRQPESFGLAGFLAAAHGRPTVAYDAGGISAWLQPPDLVPYGDRAALQARVQYYLGHPEAAAAAGAAARAHYAATFTGERHYAALLAVYRQVAA